MSNWFDQKWADWFGSPDPEAARQAYEEAAKNASVIWLLGKTQSGKSSIVAAITGEDVPIGDHFRPATRSAQVYDFPAEAPVVRFLDTRGLGEIDYDPAEDLAWCQSHAHIVLGVARATDPAQGPVVDALKRVRNSSPKIPVVIAQTCLHDLYAPGELHALPYPYAQDGYDGSHARVLNERRSIFSDLGEPSPRFVPIDLTKPSDGFMPVDYGLDLLAGAIIAAADERLGRVLDDIGEAKASSNRRLIVAYALAAGGTEAVPVVAVAAVLGIQGAMLHALAGRFGLEWTGSDFASFGGMIGTVALLRQGALEGIRQIGKLVPGLNIPVTAAAIATTAAVTYALGEAALVYLDGKRSGKDVSAEVRATFGDKLTEGFKRFRRDNKERNT